MIKSFIIIISIVAVFSGIFVVGKMCKDEDSFTVKVQGKFTCGDKPYTFANVSVAQCLQNSNNCTKAPFTFIKDTDEKEGVTGTLKDSDDDLDFIVSHDCGPCPGVLRFPIPEQDINCGNSTDKVYDFSTMKLDDTKYC
uniref:Uncharacterized protein n=1 Tax=Parastrongyloides trichosuri TaxID=131310 RepID=A0A0N4ZVV5_PARTI